MLLLLILLYIIIILSQLDKLLELQYHLWACKREYIGEGEMEWGENESERQRQWEKETVGGGGEREREREECHGGDTENTYNVHTNEKENLLVTRVCRNHSHLTHNSDS